MTRPAPTALALAVLVAVPGTLLAQGTEDASRRGWKPFEVGARIGYDNNSQGTVVGAQLHMPVVPSGVFELSPNGDVTFHPGLKDYQFALDATWVSSGRRGGFFVGGGLALRNSIFSDGETERETKAGWSAVTGLRTTPNPGTGLPVGIQIELRWVFVDEQYRPKALTFGVNVPLWGWGGRG